MDHNVILSLSKQVRELKAKNGHIQYLNIKETPGLTAVISIYDGIKPANMVLDELYEWAEKNNDEVRVLIEKLEADMTWNDEMPIT